LRPIAGTAIFESSGIEMPFTQFLPGVSEFSLRVRRAVRRYGKADSAGALPESDGRAHHASR